MAEEVKEATTETASAHGSPLVYKSDSAPPPEDIGAFVCICPKPTGPAKKEVFSCCTLCEKKIAKMPPPPAKEDPNIFLLFKACVFTYWTLRFYAWMMKKEDGTEVVTHRNTTGISDYLAVLHQMEIDELEEPVPPTHQSGFEPREEGVVRDYLLPQLLMIAVLIGIGSAVFFEILHGKKAKNEGPEKEGQGAKSVEVPQAVAEFPTVQSNRK